MKYLNGRYIFSVDDRVRIIKMSVGSLLEGQTGTILGNYSSHDTDFYLVLLDVPCPDGTKALVMISSCLEPAPSKETKH